MTVQAGDEGRAASRVRKLVCVGRLPEYLTSAARIANLDADVRRITGEQRANLTAKAQEFNVTGYTLDEESWEMAVNGSTLILSVNVVRP